jgi:hypothetical protein
VGCAGGKSSKYNRKLFRASHSTDVSHSLLVGVIVTFVYHPLLSRSQVVSKPRYLHAPRQPDESKESKLRSFTRDLIIRCNQLDEEAIEMAKEFNDDSYERDRHELIKTGGNLNLTLDLVKAGTDWRDCSAP